MKHFYAMVCDKYSISQTRECRKEWGTIQVVKFNSKKERNTFCSGAEFRIPISAKEARYYGIE